jgi:hypothetical protein
MKKLIGALALLSLLVGCGPEQTSSDKDQQQIDAEWARLNALYTPYQGIYVGTLVNEQQSTYQVEIILNVFYNSQPNPSRLTNQNYPSLSGSFNICLGNNCWQTDLNNQLNSQTYAISGAQPNSTGYMIFSSTPPANCTPATGSSFDCNPLTLVIKLTNNNNTAMGTAASGNNGVGNLNLTRKQ